jgi:cellulose synthase/poly-beta-1,6-N-acetylglucosamine synthase-like glycosyltransferase
VLWTVLEVMLVALCALVLLPTFVLFVEVVASLFYRSRLKPISANNLRVAVLVPAHNESASLVPTLSDIRTQLSPHDRLLVVADNCTDDTATIARDHHAEVIERHDDQRIGKGYALDFGIRHLSSEHPEVLLIIDADCRLSHGAVAELASIAEAMQRPAQALYLMTAHSPASVAQRASEFAWRIKNQIRPSGLHALNLPCQLMGSGMALPWRLVSKSDLASGHIVEDLKLGLDLAAQGHPPVFCPHIQVTSSFPTSLHAAISQRYRWEHGHVRMLISVGPKLVLKAIGRGDVKLMGQVLDLLVPPLALLGFVNLSVLAISGIAWISGSSALPLVLSGLSLGLMFASVLLCWISKGRDLLAVADLPLAFGYLASKVGLYRKLVSGAGVKTWVRTDRGEHR